MKKDQCLPVFEYKIFPSLRKFFFLRLGKSLWHFNLILQINWFFLNKLLSGKRFEQFSCQENSIKKEAFLFWDWKKTLRTENILRRKKTCLRKAYWRLFFMILFFLFLSHAECNLFWCRLNKQKRNLLHFVSFHIFYNTISTITSVCTCLFLVKSVHLWVAQVMGHVRLVLECAVFVSIFT